VGTNFGIFFQYSAEFLKLCSAAHLSYATFKMFHRTTNMTQQCLLPHNERQWYCRVLSCM